MRRESAIMVAALLVLAGFASQVHATTNLFVVSLAGHISSPSTGQRINAASLVTTNNFVLVSLDSTAGVVALLEGSGSVTNPVIVQVLLQSTRSIVTTNGEFSALLLPPNGAPTFTFPSGLVFGGYLDLEGALYTDRKGTVTLEADWTGVWNDPINGNSNAPPAITSAILTSSQRERSWRWSR